MAPLGKLLLLFVSLPLAARAMPVLDASKRQMFQPGDSMGIFMPKENTNLGLTTKGHYPNGIRGYWVNKYTKSVIAGTFFPDQTTSVISHGQCGVQTVQTQCGISGSFHNTEGKKLQGMYYPNLPADYGSLICYIPTPLVKPAETKLCPQSANSVISSTGAVAYFVKLNGQTYTVTPSLGMLNLGGNEFVIQGITSRSLGYIDISGTKVPLQHGLPQSYVNVNKNNYIISASTDPRFIGYVFINGQYYYVCPGNPGFIVINKQKHIIQIGEPGANNLPIGDTNLSVPPVVPPNVIIPKPTQGINTNQLITYVIYNGQVYLVRQDNQGQSYIEVSGHQYRCTGGNAQTLGYVKIDNQQAKIYHSYPVPYHVAINQENYPVLPSNDPRYTGYVKINGVYYYVKPGTTANRPGYIVYQGHVYPSSIDNTATQQIHQPVTQKKVTNFIIYNGKIYTIDSLASGHVIIQGQTYVVNGASANSLGYIQINNQQLPVYHGFIQSYITINNQNYNLIPSNDPRYIGFVFANGKLYSVTYNQNNPTVLTVNKQPYQINIGHLVGTSTGVVQQPGVANTNTYGFIIVNGVHQTVHSVMNRNEKLYYVQIGGKSYIVYPDASTVDQYGNVMFNGQAYSIHVEGGNFFIIPTTKGSATQSSALGFDKFIHDIFSNNKNIVNSFNNNGNIIGSFNGNTAQG